MQFQCLSNLPHALAEEKRKKRKANECECLGGNRLRRVVHSFMTSLTSCVGTAVPKSAVGSTVGAPVSIFGSSAIVGASVMGILVGSILGIVGAYVGCRNEGELRL